MLITSILASLGGSTNGRIISSGPVWNAPSSFRSSQEVMSPADGFQLLMQCEAVKEAHWAFRLYLARWGCACVCGVLGLSVGSGFCSFVNEPKLVHSWPGELVPGRQGVTFQ